MYVVSKVGNTVGKVISMDAKKALTSIERGLVRRATDEEIVAAGMEDEIVTDKVLTAPGSVMPDGYETEILENGEGVVLMLSGDMEPIGEPFRNMLEAREAARLHREGMTKDQMAANEAARFAAIDIPDDWREVSDNITLALAQRFEPLIVEVEAARIFLGEVQNDRRLAVGLPALDWKTGAILETQSEEKPARAAKAKPFTKRAA